MDPVLYQATVDNAQASVELAQIRVRQEEGLSKRNIGRELDLDRARANLKQAQAALVRANYELNATTVVAPLDGFVTNVNLRPGARVASLPLQPAMAFVESGRRFAGAFIMQNHLRYVEPGQNAEIAFKMYPGQVFKATVEYIIAARATGLEGTSGIPVVPQKQTHAPFGVRLILGETASALDLPSGATGSVVIYSGTGGFAHIIRKVELRLEAIMNYVNPY
jgi:multidrug resistance efflux pump